MVNRRSGLKNKKIKWLIIVITIVILAAIGIKFYLGHKEVEEMDQEIANLKQEIKKLEDKKEDLNYKIKQANSDEFIEEMARKKLGLIKEGEILYITIEEDKK